MRFPHELCQTSGVDWDAARAINVALDDLAKSRVTGIELDILQPSKLAWKFTVLRQALTYRLVDLGEASISAWNDENLLASIVLSRAFLETAAIVHFIAEQMSKHLAARDVQALDHLVMNSSFGDKRLDWVEQHHFQATNVLTALDKMSKEVDFVRDFYESISEVAHPNSFGTHQFYSTTNIETFLVSMSRTKRSRSDVFLRLNVALFAASWSVMKFDVIDELIAEIAKIQSSPGSS